MTVPSRITLTIDRLRASGITYAEAHALAAALRTSLSAHLAANPAVSNGRELLRLTVPSGAPTARGHAMGVRIGTALTGRKAGQR